MMSFAWKTIKKSIKWLFLIGGALLGSQFPSLMFQYQSRLSGHVDELQRLKGQLYLLASQSGKSLEQYIEKFRSSIDADFHQQGVFMQEIVQRGEELSQALAHLIQAPAWSKGYYFITDLNISIFEDTWQQFQPGVNLTLEGLLYTGGGFLIVWFIQRMLCIPWFRRSIRSNPTVL